MQQNEGKDVKARAAKMKQWISVGALVLTAAVVVCANFVLTIGGDKSEPAAEQASTDMEEDVFEVFRQEREDVRAKELTYIESVISSEEVSAEVRDEAQQQKLTLAKMMEQELSCEGIIMSKMGYDAVVSMSDENVSIVIDAEELGENEVAQIADIVIGATGAKAQNIKVMPRV